ncbi:FAD-binding domain-containing protein [Xylaria longipes]|nr:FAD-binding domain-containing protein [Xylaria longipes]
MARISLVLGFLALFSQTTFGLLSQDLIHVVSGSPVSQETSSITLIDHITEVANQIDTLMARVNTSSAQTAEQKASISCTIQNIVLPGSVIFMSSVEYSVTEDINWSETCWLPAACFVQPNNAVEVAVTLKVITAVKSKFAVRGGGHNANPGYSSIDDAGVLIDLQKMNGLAFEPNGITMQAGPGNRWRAMYEFSEAHGRIVKGGRMETVGIPGYLLGSGMTYFPSLQGMAADSIVNYEIVLADSSIINANANKNSDLFLSLKGGGSNFGIVTRFDIHTYPLIHAQYALYLYDIADYHNIFEATEEVQRRMEEDNKADTFVSVSSEGMVIGMFYADTPAEPPSIFKPFLSLDSQVSTLIPLTNGTVLSLAISLAAAFPTYNAKRIPTTINTLPNSTLYVSQHERFMRMVQENTFNASLSYTIEPVTSAMIREGKARGGNSCGMSEISQSSWSFVVEWEGEGGDTAALQTSNSFRDALETTAQADDLLLRYRFMNHASFAQTVLDTYGPENLDRLRSTAATYDPRGAFQELQNDGFLLRKV